MKEYPVRCCCQPKKIFGWLTLKDGLRSNQIIPVQFKPILHSVVDFDYSDNPVPVELRVVHVRLLEFVSPLQGIREVAVYSDDRPIEFWRNVEGFRENHAGLFLV